MKTNINAATIVAIAGLIVAWDEHQFGALVFLTTLGMLLFWKDRSRQQRGRADRSEKPARNKLRNDNKSV